MKKIFIAVFLVTLTVNCKKQNNSENLTTTKADTAHNPQNSSDITGTYKGVISCDDCENVELTLRDHDTYSLILYLTSEEKTADSILKNEGKYALSQDGSFISLDKYDLHFKVGEEKLFYLEHSSAKVDENEVLIKENK